MTLMTMMTLMIMMTMMTLIASKSVFSKVYFSKVLAQAAPRPHTEIGSTKERNLFRNQI